MGYALEGIPDSVGIDASPRSMSPSTRFDRWSRVRDLGPAADRSSIKKEYCVRPALALG